MGEWKGNELTTIGDAEEVRITTRRDDGSLHSPRTIWIVPHDGGLYVRSINGPSAVWYRGTRIREGGHITVGGVDRDVAFVDTFDDPVLNDALDAVYRAKYRRYSATTLDSITSTDARSTTMRLVPRESGG